MALQLREPLIFRLGAPGRHGPGIPPADVPEVPLDELIPRSYQRVQPPELPEVAERDVVRHFTRLSHLNYSVDEGIYPLGSCTMKYNPKVDDVIAALPGFAHLHPLQSEESAQGALQVMYEVQRYLCTISGMDAATLQPAAGAHGELTGMLMIRAYLRSRGEQHRNRVLVPDSAHGTNPATARMAGFEVTNVPSDERGGVDVVALEGLLDDHTAGLMLTNPNTLGLFDENILRVTDLVHRAGGQIYADGANMNAILGIARPGDMGFDVMHFNTHKTFSTPHGGGGPGAGPVTAKGHLAPFLPAPVVVLDGDRYRLDHDRPQSIGRVRAFWGSFGVLVRAWAYIRAHGPDGLRRVSEDAVLAANYLLSQLRNDYDLAYDRTCMHEFVLSAKRQRGTGVRALDVAKRLIDLGFYPPTIYFPMIVNEALMVEPTETENVRSLDELAAAFLQIARESKDNPDTVLQAPSVALYGRFDEVAAARHPNVAYRLDKDAAT